MLAEAADWMDRQRARRVPPGRRPDLPHLLRQQPRRRGDGSTWNHLDTTALGRQETWEDSPEGYPQTPPYEWWNWNDNYDEAEVSQRWKEVSAGGVETFEKGDSA